MNQMSRTTSITMPQLRYTVPTFVALFLCGVYFVIVQMIRSDAPARFHEVHLASKVPLHLTGGRIPFLDKIWDPALSFYVGAFNNQNAASYNIVVDFAFSFWPFILLVESQRTGMAGLVALPMIYGILLQRLSAAVIFPIWLLLWMHSRVRASGTDVNKTKAEAVHLGWWLGYNYPAIALNIAGRPELTSIPLWPAFPIWMSMWTAAYKLFCKYIKPSKASNEQSGYYLVQVAYAASFIISVAAHLHLCIIPGIAVASGTSPTPIVTVNKVIGLFPYLYRFYIPSTGLRTPTPAETTYDTGAAHFIQMDLIICVVAAWIAGLWDLALRNPKKFGNTRFIGTSILTLSVGGIFIGGGSVTAALWSFREAVMMKERIERKEEKRLAGEPTETTGLLEAY